MTARPSGGRCGCRGTGGDTSPGPPVAWSARQACSSAAEHIQRWAGPAWPLSGLCSALCLDTCSSSGFRVAAAVSGGAQQEKRRRTRPPGVRWPVAPCCSPRAPRTPRRPWSRADAAAASQRGWFLAGLITGGIVLVGLSVRMPVRTPFCRRPLLRRTQAMLGALAGYETFAAMAASAGPFSPVVRHRRTGCSDEFWFTPADGQASQAVIFRVNHSVHSPLPAVHISLWDGRAPAVSWPDRTVTMSGRLAGMAQPSGPGRTGAPRAPAGKPSGNGGRRYEVPAARR